MVTLDCRGQQCPLPVVQVRRQMQAAPDTPLRVLVNDAAARDNVGRLAASQGYDSSMTEEKGVFQIDLTPTAKAVEQATAPATGLTVILIASDQMGSGDPKLGQILMKNFIFTLTEGDVYPDLMLFVNGGAKLTAGGSELIEALQKLADRGVDIATCGLCLEFFDLKEALAVGRVSNMLETVNVLQSAGRIIRP